MVHLFKTLGTGGKLRQGLSACLSLLVLMVAAGAAKADPLFEAEEPLTFTIEAPLTTLFGPLLNAEEYVEGTLTQSDGTTMTIKLRPRGKTRRNPDICSFPPLRLNFKKGSVEGTVFEGQDKIKLVTHCNDRRKRYQNYYRQEYMIYRTYNLVTDESFRVRAAMVTYKDTDSQRKDITAFAFFIEEADALAKRLGMEAIKKPRMSRAEYEPVRASRYALFEYMIGNLDWATLGGPEGENCCHNSKPFLMQDGKALSVPYDFDYSGVVDATYASPPQGIELRDIRIRLFRGYCTYNHTLPQAAALFNDRREAITKLYQESTILDASDAKRTLKYYDGFYKTLNDPKNFDRKIASKCRGDF